MKTVKDLKASNIHASLQLKQMPALPDINKQIEYVQHIRKDVIPVVKPLRKEMVMIFAIEQSLLAAKRYAQSNHISQNQTDCQKILSAYNIQLTTNRIDVLKTILSRESEDFSITAIHTLLARRRKISKPAVTAAMDLFKRRGIIIRDPYPKYKKGPGRPEERFRLKISS